MNLWSSPDMHGSTLTYSWYTWSFPQSRGEAEISCLWFPTLTNQVQAWKWFMHSLPQHINTCTAVLLKTFSVISTVDFQQIEYIRRQYLLLRQLSLLLFFNWHVSPDICRVCLCALLFKIMKSEVFIQTCQHALYTCL